MSAMSLLPKMPPRAIRAATIGMLAFAVSWFCLFTPSAVQHATRTVDNMTGSCANCHTDGQTFAALKILEEKDEIEPSPPPFWIQIRVPLTSLYQFIPIVFLGYLILRYKIHLTTQMRF